ncbi:pentatricopeptide repeat-containing protein At5g47360 [Impatiens glandulifera]|uniref:pentatricopeptide repeat-containing protein At5g47360 n=1 Tax=Impatiens glandulifera TaxID=253017 RepID=UPI001FB15291|nr:pentatricopeptide repeat-containing protein At5g47360 [Impatiens glandulifera]
MSVSSLSRLLADSISRRKPYFSITTSLAFTTSSFADNYWTHLQKNDSNLEASLNSVKTELDASTVIEVLRRSVLAQQHISGLRFFIWSGHRPGYKHSSYVYRQACKLLDVKTDPVLITHVIDAYKLDGYTLSIKIFKVILNLCREADLAETGLRILKQMKEEFNCQPDMTMYNVVIRLYCSKGGMDMASDLMNEMMLLGLHPDMSMYVAMIKGFCDIRELEKACKLFEAMSEHGCKPNTVVYSALLDGFCLNGSMESGLKLLESMEKEGGDCSPNVVTYTSVIQRLCEKGKSTEALAILDRMEAKGCFPNRVTVVSLIQGLCDEGCLEKAIKMIDRVVAGGYVSFGECYSSLVIILLRMRRIEEAEKVFRNMIVAKVIPDGLAASLMIKNLCFESRYLDGFYLWNEIEKLGFFLPSIDTDIYSLLLAGLIKESNLVQVEKFAKSMADRKVHLKRPLDPYIVENLKRNGSKELQSFLKLNEESQ